MGFPGGMESASAASLFEICCHHNSNPVMSKNAKFTPYRPGAFGAETRFLVKNKDGEVTTVYENQFGQVVTAEASRLLPEGKPPVEMASIPSEESAADPAAKS
jgi:hypothetical protein